MPGLSGLLCVAGAFGLRFSSCCALPGALSHNPHPTLLPCVHHCTKEALLATTGSCPFSLMSPLFSTRLAETVFVSIHDCCLPGHDLMSGDR